MRDKRDTAQPHSAETDRADDRTAGPLRTGRTRSIEARMRPGEHVVPRQEDSGDNVLALIDEWQGAYGNQATVQLLRHYGGVTGLAAALEAEQRATLRRRTQAAMGETMWDPRLTYLAGRIDVPAGAAMRGAGAVEANHLAAPTYEWARGSVEPPREGLTDAALAAGGSIAATPSAQRDAGSPTPTPTSTATPTPAPTPSPVPAPTPTPPMRTHTEDKPTEEQVETILLHLIAPGLTTPPASGSLVPEHTGVTADVALNILDNMSRGEPAFKPELGKGGCSWFVSEGNPYVGIDPEKSVNLPISIAKSTHLLTLTEHDLLAMFEGQRGRIDMYALEAAYRREWGIPADEGLNRQARKAVQRVADRAAESRMWDEVGERVRASDSKVGEVILKDSRFSRQGDGKFLVVADGAKIEVKGGVRAVVGALEHSGYSVEPVVRAAAEQLAVRQNWAGRVQGVFRYGGRILIVVAVADDLYTIYRAHDKVKAVVTSVGGWAGASAGAAAFAAFWTPADVAGPWAWVAHGAGTLVASGIGYWVGSEVTRTIYELVVE